MSSVTSSPIDGPKPRVNRAVIDASVVLATLKGEPGGERLTDLRAGRLISSVNLTEVLSRLLDLEFSDRQALSMVEALGLTIVPFDAQTAVRAGLMRDKTRAAGLSLGDRACLALAEALSLPVLTADRNWDRVTLDVEVHQIR